MRLGIVGLPNVGKSTLFNALTKGGAAAANYAFCTIEPNVGVVAVPDVRLDALSEMYAPEKRTSATVEFLDIAGLVKGASEGEGLGNKFLSHIREVDAIVHVVRCFEDDDIIHVENKIDPVRDADTINAELCFSDIEILERRAERMNKQKKGDAGLKEEADALHKVLAALYEGISVRQITKTLTESELGFIRELPLLSAKPVLYAANVDEETLASGLENPHYKALSAKAAEENAGIIPICAQIEAELAKLDDDERREYVTELYGGMGLAETGLDRLIRASYALLGLISFLTAGPKEVRAWTIVKGTKAPQAAGKIHGDFERGFIRAEVVSFDDLMAKGSLPAAAAAGLLKSEGKEYVMKDGDVVLFRFNV